MPERWILAIVLTAVLWTLLGVMFRLGFKRKGD